MPSPAYDRFTASMVMDFDKWHDGLSYDIEALSQVTREEAERLTDELVAKTTLDWRDVEALRALATPKALARLAVAATTQSGDGGAQALIHAIEVQGWTPKIEKRFIELLEKAVAMSVSLDRLYRVAEAHPTPAVIAEVFRGARLAGDAATRYSFGAFLLYLSGYADNWYGLDEPYRPHLLELNSADYTTYNAAIAWLQDKLANPRPKT